MGKKKQDSAPSGSADDYEDELLSRYLVDKKGRILGESIGIDGPNIILKHKNKFYLIPRKSVRLKGKKLVLKTHVDWVGALAKGEGWKREELDPLWGKKKPPSSAKPKPQKTGKKKGPVKKSEVKKPPDKAKKGGK